MSKIDHVCGYGTYVLAQELENNREKTTGGIIIPESAKKAEWFKVVTVGPDATKGYVGLDGSKKQLKKGDCIVFFQGVNVDIDGKRYQSVPENNIMNVLPAEAL